MQNEYEAVSTRAVEGAVVAIVADDMAWALEAAQRSQRSAVRTLIRSYDDLSDVAADVVVVDGRQLGRLRTVERAITASDLAVVCVLPQPHAPEARVAWMRAGVRSLVDWAASGDDIALIAMSLASRRRSQAETSGLGGWHLNPREQTLSLGADVVPLTSAEYRIVHFLLAQQGRWVESSRLSAYVAPGGCAGSTLSVYVSRLRKKLGGLVESSRGKGYRLVHAPAENLQREHPSPLGFQALATCGPEDVPTSVTEATLRSVLEIRRTLLVAGAAAVRGRLTREEIARECDRLLTKLRDALDRPAWFFELEVHAFRVLAEHAQRPVLAALTDQARVFWSRAPWYRALHAQTTRVALSAYEDASRALRDEDERTVRRTLERRFQQLDGEILQAHARHETHALRVRA